MSDAELNFLRGANQVVVVIVVIIIIIIQNSCTSCATFAPVLSLVVKSGHL